MEKQHHVSGFVKEWNCGRTFMIGFIYFYILIFYKHVFCKLRNPQVSLRDSNILSNRKKKRYEVPQAKKSPIIPLSCLAKLELSCCQVQVSNSEQHFKSSLPCFMLFRVMVFLNPLSNRSSTLCAHESHEILSRISRMCSLYLAEPQPG